MTIPRSAMGCLACSAALVLAAGLVLRLGFADRFSGGTRRGPPPAPVPQDGAAARPGVALTPRTPGPAPEAPAAATPDGALAGEPESRVRGQIVLALSQNSDPLATEALVKAAASALGKIGGLAAARALAAFSGRQDALAALRDAAENERAPDVRGAIRGLLER